MSKIFISNKKRGITLVEVLISAAILVLAITGILYVFVQTIDMSKRTDYEYVSLNLAKSRMERARNVMATSGFDSLPEMEESETTVDAYGASDPQGEFKRTTQVTVIDANRTEFEVTVKYKYRKSWRDDAAVTFKTMFTDAG